MKRRSFIGLLIGAAAAITFRAASQVEPDITKGTNPWWNPNTIPGGVMGTQLSYITRRSLLGPAYSQIYDTSPLLVKLNLSL